MTKSDRRPGLGWQRLVAVLAIVSGCHRGSTETQSQAVSGRTVSTATESPAVSSPARISFLDQTERSQVAFTYQNDSEHSGFAILESLGGGVAIIDYDEDGKPDLVFTGGGAFDTRQTRGLPGALFRNRGDWRFENVTSASGVGRSGHYSHGAIAADFNEDGFDDVLITGYGGLSLFRNCGDGTFGEVTRDAELSDQLWSSSAAWGDFNGDGSLDLFVAHYVDWTFDKDPFCPGPPGHSREVCPPRQFDGLPDVLYFGNGDGTFRIAPGETGLAADGKGLGVVAADIDLDSDLDLYVANDTVGNFLYRNDGHGRFEDISLVSGTGLSADGTPDGSMGTDISDFNGDGLPDIWVANYERENNALYRNLGMGLFRHVSQSVGIAAVGSRFVGWGTRFLDVDLDGDEDLIVANGHVIRFPVNSPRRQSPLLLENSGGARFINVSNEVGAYFSSAHEGRGLATGDLDADGDEDVVISNLNEPVAVLSNETRQGNSWLMIRLVGRQSVRSSIGAVVVARMGDRSLTRQIRGGSSYASTSSKVLNLGCGNAAIIDELTVQWNSGARWSLQKIKTNQLITVIEPGHE